MLHSKKANTATDLRRDEDWPSQGPFGTSRKTDQLLADYLERAEALAVPTELLYCARETKSPMDWDAAWNQAEDALNNVCMARFALAQQIRNPESGNSSGGKVVTIKSALRRP